jgi:hypothetical protein
MSDEPEIKKGSKEWFALQAETLRKMRALVSDCHPWVPAMPMRDGSYLCGNLNCRKVVRPAKPTEAQPDRHKDAYQPEPYIIGEDGEQGR